MNDLIIKMNVDRLDNIVQLLENIKKTEHPQKLLELIPAMQLLTLEIREIKEHMGGMKTDICKIFEIIDN